MVCLHFEVYLIWRETVQAATSTGSGLKDNRLMHLLCKFHTRACYLIQNSQAVKKVCGPQKGYGEKRCEIQGGGQEMAVMVG